MALAGDPVVEQSSLESKERADEPVEICRANGGRDAVMLLPDIGWGASLHIRDPHEKVN